METLRRFPVFVEKYEIRPPFEGKPNQYEQPGAHPAFHWSLLNANAWGLNQSLVTFSYPICGADRQARPASISTPPQGGSGVPPLSP